MTGEAEREKRARKTNVTQLDYLYSGEVISQKYITPETLSDALNEKLPEKDENEIPLRLFVVEDLSRDVIELLGARLDIEPAFFLEHVVDYNTRQCWVGPPNPNIVAKWQRWLQLHCVTARYFETIDSFKKGYEEAEYFNVLRDDGQNNKSIWDNHGAIVGLTRTEVSFWLRSAESQTKGAVGKCKSM